MRKVWAAKVLLLCMVCTLCLYGNCAAEDEKENWVQFYYKGDKDIFYVDTNSIRVREYEGRKYLDVHIRRREQRVEQLILINRWIEVKNAEFHIVYDITNGKNVVLEAWNKYNNPQKWTNDISAIQPGNEPDDIDDKLLLYVNQNYPAIMQEIRTHNQSVQNTSTISGLPALGGAGSSNLSIFPSLDVTYDDMVYDASTDTYRNYGTYHFYNNGPRLPMDAGAPSGLKYVYTLRYSSNRKNFDFSIDYYIDPQSVSRYSGISGDTVRGIFYKHVIHDDWSGWSTWTVQGFKVYIDYNWYSIWGGERDEENAIRWGWGPVANAAAFDETRYIFNDEDHTPEEIERMLSESPSYDVLLEEYIGKPTLRFHAKEDIKNDHGGDPHYNSTYFDNQLRAIALLSAVDY